MLNQTESTLRKVSVRVLPILFAGAVMANLDRSNVGMAALQMNADIGLSRSAHGFGAGAFFIAYALSEVPSNMATVCFGARRWLGRILVTWE